MGRADRYGEEVVALQSRYLFLDFFYSRNCKIQNDQFGTKTADGKSTVEGTYGSNSCYIFKNQTFRLTVKTRECFNRPEGTIYL